MSDPLSTAASVLTVLAAGIALADKLYALRSASSDMECLSNDMTELCGVLQPLQQQIDNISEWGLQGDELPASLMANIKPALRSCLETFDTLTKYLDRQKKDLGSARGKLRWLWGANELAGMRAQLAERKVTLNMALLATSCILNYNIACTTKCIQRELTDLTDALSEDMKRVSKRCTIGSDISGVMLRRHMWSTYSSSTTPGDEDGQTDMDGFKRWSRRASCPNSLRWQRRRTWDSTTPDMPEMPELADDLVSSMSKDARRYSLVTRRRSTQSTVDICLPESVEDSPLPPYSAVEYPIETRAIHIPQSKVGNIDEEHQPASRSLEIFSPDSRDVGSYASMWGQYAKRATRWSLVVDGKLNLSSETQLAETKYQSWICEGALMI